MQTISDISVEHPPSLGAQVQKIARDAINSLHRFRGSDGTIAHDKQQAIDEARPDENPASSGFSWATVVAIEALLEAMAAHPYWLDDSARITTIDELLPELIRQDPNERDRRLPEAPENQILVLRKAVLLRALCRLSVWRPRKGDFKVDGEAGGAWKVRERTVTDLQERARQEIRALARALTEELGRQEASTLGKLHPFTALCLHEALGAAAAATSDDDSEVSALAFAQGDLWEAHRGRVERLLANASVGGLDPSGAIELAFYAGLAGEARSDDYAQAALTAVGSRYLSAAWWQQGRILMQDQRDGNALETLLVPPFELLNVLARLVTRSLGDTVVDPISGRGDALKMLTETIEIVGADYVPDAPKGPGWMGELSRECHAEAWPTAAVLRFMTAMDDALHGLQRRRLLEEFGAKSSWGHDWPTYLKWEDHYLPNEPDGEAKILAFIHEKIVTPRRDPGGSSEGKIVLLFGPPGTTKTSIARSVANGLGWPIISLSPGDFIRGGLDQIEQNSTRIFDRLEKLSRTVVILDECDELFRERDPEATPDSMRQIAGFMTASMLPKLQDLHDRSRVVVFICTNFLTSMDPAIKRPGRIDYLIAVPPSDDAQRKRTILEEMDMDPQLREQIPADVIDAAVDTAVANTSDLIRGEIVNLARELGRTEFTTVADAKRAARRLAKQAMNQDRRTIKTRGPKARQYRKFQEDMKAISEPHRNLDSRRDGQVSTT
jgi:AAA+ superfamily predicted ATPase